MQCTTRAPCSYPPIHSYTVYIVMVQKIQKIQSTYCTCTVQYGESVSLFFATYRCCVGCNCRYSNTACFLHNQASAEAYSSLAAQRFNLSSCVSKGSDHVRTKMSLKSNYDKKATLSLGRVLPRRPTMLRSGGDIEPTKRFWNSQLARELFAEMIGTGMIVQIGMGAGP
jgi:hypothetical protein